MLGIGDVSHCLSAARFAGRPRVFPPQFSPTLRQAIRSKTLLSGMLPGSDDAPGSGSGGSFRSDLVTARTAQSSLRFHKKKPVEKTTRRSAPFGTSARSHRLAERSNYSTTYNRHRMAAAMVLPVLALIFVFVTTIVFLVSISVKMIEHSATIEYTSQPRLHQVLRIANKGEIRNGELVEFKYPTCGEEVYVGCWKEADLTTVGRMDEDPGHHIYIRNVFAYVKPEENVVCPPSIFIGEKSPEKENCTSIYDL
ncbi:hypothetical protein Aduo_015297 [Ancylostoma duodenale]